jgi:hypothetical protein
VFEGFQTGSEQVFPETRLPAYMISGNPHSPGPIGQGTLIVPLTNLSIILCRRPKPGVGSYPVRTGAEAHALKLRVV